ncbi:MAG: RNA polymerase sigma-70 factor [Ilumatobacteraceae bacterium]
MDQEPEQLKLIARGDQAAFRSIFDHYRDLIYSIAYRVLKDNALAEDTVQEVFFKLWMHRKTLPDIHNFRAYINTVTRNYLYTSLKRLALAENYLRKVEGDINKSPETSIPLVEFEELNAQVHKIVRLLPPQQRKVFQLGKEEGLKYEEIASHLNISKETVKTHMSEALKSIKRQLIQYHYLTGSSLLPLLISVFFVH